MTPSRLHIIEVNQIFLAFPHQGYDIKTMMKVSLSTKSDEKSDIGWTKQSLSRTTNCIHRNIERRIRAMIKSIFKATRVAIASCRCRATSSSATVPPIESGHRGRHTVTIGIAGTTTASDRYPRRGFKASIYDVKDAIFIRIQICPGSPGCSQLKKQAG